MVTDPIGDMLTQVRNAGMAGKSTISLPFSKLKYQVAMILSRQGYVGAVAKHGEDPKASLSIEILYEGKKAKIVGIKRISKPGLRWYAGHTELKSVIGGLGFSIVSTSKGIMTNREARKLGIGGEIMAEIW
jgi:small subunit ribosomal protein S8